MDHPRGLSSLFTTLFAISLVFGIANGFGGVMKVHRRFVGNHHHFEELKQHDARRHARFLRSSDVIDAPLGGNATQGLYYTHLSIGTPPRNYTVQIDTGSPLLWIFCQGCVGCPMDDDALGIHLTPYNPKTSKTAKIIAGGKGFCKDHAPKGNNNGPCPFQVEYADGTNLSGYYVRDYWRYNKLSGGNKSEPAKAKITFGCARHFTGKQPIELGVEGLIGLGFEDGSVIAQLGASGRGRREFAHCLEPVRGGGIFAIGHVVKPELKMLPFDPDYSYSLMVQSVEVGGNSADLKTIGGEVELEDRLALIDSGTSMCRLPEALNNFVIKEIFSNKSNLNVFQYQNGSFSCFNHSGSVDITEFPPVNFHLSGVDHTEATLTVHPRDYVIQADEHTWCIGIGKEPNGSRGLILGDVALAHKLVIYDAENYKIGWTEYDCSSSIEVEDGKGKVCDVGAHSESSPT